MGGCDDGGDGGASDTFQAHVATDQSLCGRLNRSRGSVAPTFGLFGGMAPTGDLSAHSISPARGRRVRAVGKPCRCRLAGILGFRYPRIGTANRSAMNLAAAIERILWHAALRCCSARCQADPRLTRAMPYRAISRQPSSSSLPSVTLAQKGSSSRQAVSVLGTPSPDSRAAFRGRRPAHPASCGALS